VSNYLQESYLATKKETKKRETEGSRAGTIHCEAPTKDIVREALKFYPNNDLPYDDWIRIGFALYSAFGDGGQDIWEQWSAGYSKNDPEVTTKKWSSFCSVRNITIKTLYFYTREGGWHAHQSEGWITDCCQAHHSRGLRTHA
jgi:hypothetical protein